MGKSNVFDHKSYLNTKWFLALCSSDVTTREISSSKLMRRERQRSSSSY